MNVEQSEIDYTFFDCLRITLLSTILHYFFVLVLETMTAFWMKREIYYLLFSLKGDLLLGGQTKAKGTVLCRTTNLLTSHYLIQARKLIWQ